MSDERKFELYRKYSDIIIRSTENQLEQVSYKNRIKDKISKIILNADMNKIRISTTSSVVQSFITHYLYDQVQEILKTGQNEELSLIKVDFRELENYLKMDDYDYFLYDRLMELKDIFENILTNDFNIQQAQVAFTDMPKNVSLNFIGSKHIGKTVTFEGTITKLSQKFGVLKNAMFECRGCMRHYNLNQNTLFLTNPGICPECGGRNFKLIPEES